MSFKPPSLSFLLLHVAFLFPFLPFSPVHATVDMYNELIRMRYPDSNSLIVQCSNETETSGKFTSCSSPFKRIDLPLPFIPSELVLFPSLQYIGFVSDPTFPSDFPSLPNLVDIGLNLGRSTSFPTDVFLLTKLTTLRIKIHRDSNLSLGVEPLNLSRISSLKTLELTSLRTFPESIMDPVISTILSRGTHEDPCPFFYSFPGFRFSFAFLFDF